MIEAATHPVDLANWSYDGGRKALYRRVVCEDFGAALALIIRIGLEAEKADHHPELFNVYNRLDIWLTTHDAGDVTMQDHALARRIDALVASQR